MNCQDVRTLLDEWIDDAVTGSRREEIRAHLDSCADCRRTEAELRELLARVAALPRVIDPPHDLWPGILEGIDRGKVVRPEFGGRDRAKRWLLLAAAALVLVVASSGLTALFLNRTATDGTAPGEPDVRVSTVAWEEFEAAEQEYQRVTGDLLEALDARRGELSEETIEIVETNLTLIDQAIREARAALEQDPANASLATKVTDIYRKRVEFLQAMSRL